MASERADVYTWIPVLLPVNPQMSRQTDNHLKRHRVCPLVYNPHHLVPQSPDQTGFLPL